MPIWLRRFTFNKIKQFYDEQNNEQNKSAENSWLSGEAKEQAAQNKLKGPSMKALNTQRKASSK